MIEASTILSLSLGFLVVWGVVALVHGLVASRSTRGNPLPPEPELHHDEH